MTDERDENGNLLPDEKRLTKIGSGAILKKENTCSPIGKIQPQGNNKKYRPNDSQCTKNKDKIKVEI